MLAGGSVLATMGIGATAHAGERVSPSSVLRTSRRAGDVIAITPGPGLELPIRFGTEVKSVARAEKAGLSFGYGVLWTGAWNQKYGWDTPQQELREAEKWGVVPVVHWRYWGDEIGPSVVENRVVVDMRHQVRKDEQTWFRMAGELADMVAREMGGREAVVVLETEFDKDGIENHEFFDGYLAEQARIFKSRGNIKVVLGFSNWGRSQWSRFDRAIAESDMLGTQLLRSSVREPAGYLKAVDTLLAGARTLHARFRKPVMIMDLALSSYPSSEYEQHQATVLRQLFSRLGELKAAGVTALIWRQIVDDPQFDSSSYHGQAGRHWGVLRSDGSPKPGFQVLRDGMRAEQAEPAGS